MLYSHDITPQKSYYTVHHGASKANPKHSLDHLLQFNMRVRDMRLQPVPSLYGGFRRTPTSSQ